MKVGLAASALPIAMQAQLATGAEALPTVPLYKVLYDTRFPASVAFARRAAAGGLVAQAIEGDMTRFWYEDLYHRWQRGPAAIAGLTAHGALFCLERLAWDQRMRVVFRGEHSLESAGCVTHRFEGPAALLPTAKRAATESFWAEALADVVAACPRDRAQRQQIRALTAHAETPPVTEALFSWVIAPVTRG